MKRYIIAVTLTLGVAGAVVGHAGEDGTGFYLRGDLGVAITPEADVEQFLGPWAGAPDGMKVEFEPGMRLGIAGGYRPLPWLGLEFETGFALNSLDSLGSDESIDAAMFQVPLLANVVIQCNNLGKFKPYIGAGVGGVASTFVIDDTVSTAVGPVYLEGAGSDLVFAYQAFAGVRYEFSDKWSVGVIYRLLGSSGAAWEVEDDFDNYVGEVKFDDLITHSVSAQFELKF